MSDDFNPYHKWLGIPLNQQPADHYRLLGLEQGESDPDVITHAAEQRKMHLKSISSGVHRDLSRLLINEISQACGCLLNPEQRVAYDALLQAKQNKSSFPIPPPLHSAALPEWLPRDDCSNEMDDAVDDQFCEEETSPPLPIHIDTGSRPPNNTAGDRPAEINKIWEELDTQLAEMPENLSSGAEFANIGVAEKQKKFGPPESSPTEPMADVDEANHAGMPMPAPFPPVPHVEGPPAAGPMNENAPTFPTPPPLPTEKNRGDLFFAHDEHAPPWTAPSHSVKDPPCVDPPPHYPFQYPFQSDPNDPMAAGRADELAGEEIFAPATSTGTLPSKNSHAKANRKKHKWIFWLGHLLAPIIGLYLGWIILQYLKTK